MLKLNIGCGRKQLAGYVNVDNNPLCQPDVFCDLDQGLKPFADQSVAYLRAEHVLEHLDDLMFSLEEMYRISQDGATWEIMVPHYSYGFAHPFHKRGFSFAFFDLFDRRNPESYGQLDLELKSVRLNYTRSHHPFLKFIGIPINFFANMHRGLCERCWCYLVGGFEEIQFQVIVRKPGAQSVPTANETSASQAAPRPTLAVANSAV